MGWLSRLFRRADPLAPRRLPSPDELVLLVRPQGEAEAVLFRDMLVAEGINSLVKNRDAASVNAGGMGPPWAYELWVLRRDLARARVVLGIGSEG